MKLHCLAVPILMTGCFTPYSEGTLRYVDHPDLTAVRLASSGGDPKTGGLGRVTASATGSGPCDEVAAVALRDLLAEAKAIGAHRVEEVQFRGRWDWLGRVVCRGTRGTKTAQVRGIAVE